MKTVLQIATFCCAATLGSAFIQGPLLPTSSAPSQALQASSDNEAVTSRREFFEVTGTAAVGAGLLLTTGFNQAANAQDGPYSLPPLPYPYEALEPHIDAATMKFHHDKHHAAYVANVNKAMAGKPAVSITDLQKEALKTGGGVRNAGGGHYNHGLFWNTLCAAKDSGAPSGALAKAIDESFGSLDAMKEEFAKTAAGVFGSGWAWIGVADGKLAITSTPNQDNPLMDGANCTPMIPILGLDVWEHAYYLKYQNRRPEYISAFWNVVNWAKVGEYYDNYAIKGVPVPVEG